jgi:lipid-binding SYLF domain-containing protein
MEKPGLSVCIDSVPLEICSNANARFIVSQTQQLENNNRTTTAQLQIITNFIMLAQNKPDPTTMEGMIYNANKVLDRALSPETNGVHCGLFQKTKGVVLISSVEAGFIFSDNVGTGILTVQRDNGKWIPPSALGLPGIGWGFIVGASVKDLMVFLFDEQTVNALAGDMGIKLGAQAEVTVGPWERTVDATLNLSNGGVGTTVTVAYTKGFFGGLSIEGAALGTRKAVNEKVCNSSASPQHILFEDRVQVPADNSLMPEVYRNLEMLAKGQTATESVPKTEDYSIKEAQVETEDSSVKETPVQTEETSVKEDPVQTESSSVKEAPEAVASQEQSTEVPAAQ